MISSLVVNKNFCQGDKEIFFRAFSNTFDYTVTLEGGPGDPDTVLRGVDERADLGLLSLFEHYQSTTVGEHLKTPAFPIWLVCSESHFSVLW